MNNFDQFADERDVATFHVRRAGHVTLLEAPKGVDWLSMFPDEPGTDRAPLIALPTLPPALTHASAMWPSLPADCPPQRQSIEAPPPPDSRHVPLTMIAISTAALLVMATVLYFFAARTQVEVTTSAEPRPAAPVAASIQANSASVNHANGNSDGPQSLAVVPALTPVLVSANWPTTTGRVRSAMQAGPAVNARNSAAGSALSARSSPSPASSPSPSPVPAKARPTPTPSPRAQAAVTTVKAPQSTPLVQAPPPAFTAPASNSALPSTETTTPVPTFTPPPPPTPSPLAIGAPPAGAMPAPRPTTVPALAPPRPSPTPSRATETAAVRSVLDQYRGAYESLRSEAVQAVWPGANARALARAFDQIVSQSVEFDSCGIEISAASAEATCTGSLKFVPKVGGGKDPRVEPRSWSFYLRRQNDRWIIDRVVSR